jgi:transcriptional regulator with XRE-family HTH domain
MEILLLQRNIRYLCKKRGIHLGEFEKTLGLSKGYFSRIGKTRDDLPVTLVSQVAQSFGVQLDDLVYRDLEKEDGEPTEL